MGRTQSADFEVRFRTAAPDVVGAAGVYAAIAICMLSFLMTPDHATIFSGRMTVLVGALFATVVNMQVGKSVLGSPEAVSLVDEIHILALAYVLFAALMGALSWRDFDKGRGLAVLLGPFSDYSCS